MTNVAVSCHNCGQQVQILPGQSIARRDSCDSCDADLHCCRNCRFLDPSKHNECTETQAEWVKDKERANFCDYFEPRMSVNLTNRPKAQQENSKNKFDALFKRKT